MYSQECYKKLKVQVQVWEVSARIRKEMGMEKWVTIDAGRT